MPARGDAPAAVPVTESVVVVGVDGSGRTHRLGELAVSVPGAIWLSESIEPGAQLEDEIRAAGAAGLLVVDDAHRHSPAVLDRLTAAARSGLSMALARRPGIGAGALARLDAVLADVGRVEALGPLDETALAALLSTAPAARTGSAAVDPTRSERLARLRLASGAMAAIAVALAPQVNAQPASAALEPPAGLTARVARKLAQLDTGTARAARVLALRAQVSDAVLAEACDLSAVELGAAMARLRDEGLLVASGETMIPAVAEALLADLAPTQLRQAQDGLAAALLASGGDPVAAAQLLRAAGARTASAALAYLAAGARLRFTDPGAALDWYADAADSRGEHSDPAGRAEAMALVGLDVDTDVAATAGQTADLARRLRLVDGAVAAHQGRAARAGEILTAADDPGPLLAVVSLVSAGRLAAARSAAAGGGPVALRLLAEAALAALDPQAAVPALIEACEAVLASPGAVVLPDTPHAVGAIVAVTAGDISSAEHLLTRALDRGFGGPVAVRRHRLLLAWSRMRAGRFDTAVTEVARYGRSSPAGRERLLLSVLQTGLARRSGDIAGLRAAWPAADQVLARRTVDLLQLEAAEELLAAAVRLRRPQRVAPVLADLQQVVDGLDRPPAWVLSLAWLRLQLAVDAQDADAARVPAQDALSLLAAGRLPGARQQAQAHAAACWLQVLDDVVDPETVAEAAERLAAAQLPWEAARLAGQAAIRSRDPAAARRLLERARDLSVEPADDDRHAGAGAAGGGTPTVGAGGRLSDREIEVARLVAAGRTHREIGAQLFLSPKTVEHHAARIRTKLGASTRAEFLVALRGVLGPDGGA